MRAVYPDRRALAILGEKGDPSELAQNGKLMGVFGPEAGLLAVYSPERAIPLVTTPAIPGVVITMWTHHLLWM
jgi:hypothetical protein